VDDGPRGWARPLYERALDAAGAGPGTTLLELGCGSGEFARAALERGAVVTGIDADRSAVSVAAAAVPGAEFRVGDAHDPPPGPFDVVAAVQLLSHVTNPVLVLRRAASVGTTVVVTVWGRDEECDVRAFGEALAPWLPSRRRAEDGSAGPPPMTDPDRMRKIVALAGLRVTALHEVVCPFDYADVDELVAPVLGSAIGRRAAAAAGPDAVRRALLDRLAGHRLADGGYRLENVFRVYTVKP
jgi:SAM-dependent methyltransferase